MIIEPLGRNPIKRFKIDERARLVTDGKGSEG